MSPADSRQAQEGSIPVSEDLNERHHVTQSNVDAVSTRVQRFSRGIASTATANLIALVASGSTGILITRSLGPLERGHYAAITAWFGVILVVGELGQTAATTFFVARDPQQARRYVATSRNLMLASGFVTLVGGLLGAPLLASGDASTHTGFILMFATCIVSYVGASFTFSLQAVQTLSWNAVRVSQPLAFAALVWCLHASDSLTLLTCVGAVSVTVFMQTGLAYLLCRRNGLTSGSGDRPTARAMSRYGLHQMAGAVPAILVARLDQLALSVAVDPATLGHYAAATSLTSLALPAVSAIGSVIFPRIALQHQDDVSGSRAMHRRAIGAALILSAMAAVVMMTCARWFVPLLFGDAYRAAVPLVWILAPGVAFLACSQVCADVLRGYGHPLIIAKTQWLAAAVAVILMVILLPRLGAFGAAAAMLVSAGVSCISILLALRRLTARPERDGRSEQEQR
jgi:O-antigen/teichoic acid export membrane protein